MIGKSDGYSTAARLLHWLVAVLALLMITAGFTMVQEGLPRATQDTLFIFHKNTGVLLLLIMLVRLIVRHVKKAPPTPPHLAAWQRVAADVSHFMLYVMLFVMPISGYIRVRAERFPIEGLDALGIGPFMPRSDNLAEIAQTVHFFGAFILVALIAVHIGAALQHLLIHRDGVFSRMWPPVSR